MLRPLRTIAAAAVLLLSASRGGAQPADPAPVESKEVMTGGVEATQDGDAGAAPTTEPAAPAAPAAPASPPGYAPPPPPPGSAPPPGPYYPGPYYPPPRPVMVAPPAEEPGRHLHDGFYMRLGLGAGALAATYQSDSNLGTDADIGGAGLGIDIWLGGTPWPGLVIGGGISGNSVDEPKIEAGGTSQNISNTTLTASMLGLFVDGFPDPEGGFHVGGMLGIATLTFRDEDRDEEQRHGGGGAALWAGYAGWIGSDWSLGGMLRLAAQATEHEDSDRKEKARARSLSVLVTALYH
ncbi:MAG: hypothetical protein R3B13_23750 [Polyangiaceae bacterium]